MIPKKSKIKYLTNRDLMSEIHKSKCSYSSFVDSKYSMYDLIVKDLAEITSDAIDQAKIIRAKRIGNELFSQAREAGDRKTKLVDCIPSPLSIKKTDLVFRIMTYDHIPLSPGRKRVTKTIADTKERVNFPPFQHWMFDQDDQLICVGKSHWVGGMDNGYFSREQGITTENLGLMYMMLADRYAQRGNWRGYCVDTETEALTKRGWLKYDTITEQDEILSYSNGQLTWSKIKSIYRGEFDGLMHYICGPYQINMLITPGHKLLTTNGLKKVEELTKDDVIILTGKKVDDTESYSPSESDINTKQIVVTKLGSISAYDSQKKIFYIFNNLTLKFSDLKFYGEASCDNVVPTYPYKGIVWCPQTEYGTFVCRRNGAVHLTGNTYIDEMKGQAILQLSQVGLQFDESKSENPFAYFTSVVNNSFTRILNLEKKNQNIRDDLLEDSGYTPSSTRQSQELFAEETARQAKLYKSIKIPKTTDDASDSITEED
jgi:hypothetical protein